MVARPRSRSSSTILTLCAAALALLAACADRQAPETLQGRWIPQDPRYEGRSLAIASGSVALGQGGVRSQMFPIESVRSEPGSEGGTLHEIRYRTTEGDAQVMRLLALPGNPPTLRFENHDEHWVREDGSASPSRGDS